MGLKILNSLEFINHHHLENNDFNGVEEIIVTIRETLEIKSSDVLETLIPNLTGEVYKQIESLVSGVEHIAFMVPQETKIELLKTIASQTGFSENQVLFPSTFMAKELGKLIGKKEVPLQIFKAFGKNDRNEVIGIEVFIPKEKNSIVHQWIDQGICTHIALRAKSYESIEQINRILKAQHIEMAEIMQGAPRENLQEGSVSAYYDTYIGTDRFRLEFYFKSEFNLEPKED